MDYIKLTIETTGAAAEVLAAALSHISPYCQIDDPGDVALLTDAPSPRWDYLGEELFENQDRAPTVTFYFEQGEQGRLLLQEAEAAVLALRRGDETGFYGPLSLQEENVRSEDWENNWKQYYKPFAVGRRLLVRPSWESAENPEGRRVLVIDPASSFGTGGHATTRLCMEALDGMELRGAAVLDMGCGSGILSIISLLLGADSAFAVDIDPNAVDIAYQNAGMNDVDISKYTVKAGDIITNTELQNEIAKNEYDVVVANIVADVIIALAPKAREYMKKGGVFITSGIIEDRVDDVKTALEKCGFEINSIKQRKDWVSIVCK